ncbi:IPP transferase-domain-containing protein [Pavlovales sp. CCMP2436]|nr:IPP transferase-domain-containing protein [Pavlovales sp. CCMP2436]
MIVRLGGHTLLVSLLAASMVAAVACRRSLRSMMKLAAAPPLRPVILIAGPTGVGKSEVAMQLALRLGGEIVSVDSVQVYRSLDIGANKPSAAELARVTHHLLDLREPDEAYTAGDFYRDASVAIAEIQARGRTPICVGGTSMYMHWLVAGTPTAPKADPELVAAAEARLAPLRSSGDWDTALALLAANDPERAAALSRNDWYRLTRALTIATQTGGTPLAELERVDGCAHLHEMYDLRPFFLFAPRQQLAHRIDARCEQMLIDGLLRETYEGLANGRLLPESQPGRAVGYRQALEYLTRPDAQERDAAALTQFVADFAQASRAYAAQQMKWFRKERAFEWLEVRSPADVEEVATQIELVCALSKTDELARRASVQYAAEQEAAYRRNLEEGSRMKLYLPAFPTSSRADVVEQLLAQADGFRKILNLALRSRAADP